MKSQIPMLEIKELRQFGLITGAILIVLFVLFIPWVFDQSFPVWPWVVAGILWSMALLYPKALRPVYRVWMLFGHVIGAINTRIILGIMFFVVIFPMAVVMSLFGYDPMRRKLEKQIETYRISSQIKNKKHVEKPF